MITHDNIDLPDLPPCFEVLTDRTHSEIRAYALAAIKADRKSRGGPAGWRIVPIDPTIEMLDAGEEAMRDFPPSISRYETQLPPKVAYYRAMINAAPQPAEPVKVPSDTDDLAYEIWAADRIGALLARYGAQPAARAPTIGDDGMDLLVTLLGRHDRGEIGHQGLLDAIFAEFGPVASVEPDEGPLPPPGLHYAPHYATFLRREARKHQEPTRAAMRQAARMIERLGVERVRLAEMVCNPPESPDSCDAERWQKITRMHHGWLRVAANRMWRDGATLEQLIDEHKERRLP